jgi:hypothetical protein
MTTKEEAISIVSAALSNGLTADSIVVALANLGAIKLNPEIRCAPDPRHGTHAYWWIRIREDQCVPARVISGDRWGLLGIEPVVTFDEATQRGWVCEGPIYPPKR